MKAISYNMGEWQVVSDHLSVKQGLPALTYTVRYTEEKGFFLKEEPKLVLNEKMYGKSKDNMDKIVEAYKEYNRSLGCIFSGDKGLGKSMSMRYLAQKMTEMNYPIIIVDQYIKGIARFLMSITCDAVIIFDEFDKTFSPELGKNESKYDKQNEMLSLFDGMNSSKFLFIITCNSLIGISEFLLDRPGRFHYHVKFGYPKHNEVEEYLRDNLKEEYFDIIPDVLTFCDANRVNFDGIRSICFEINLGRDFDEAIRILNIDQNKRVVYNIKVILSDKSVYEGTIPIGSSSPTFSYYRRRSTGSKAIRLFLDNLKSGKSIECIVPRGSVVFDTELDKYKISKPKDIVICEYLDSNYDRLDAKDLKVTKAEILEPIDEEPTHKR